MSKVGGGSFGVDGVGCTSKTVSAIAISIAIRSPASLRNSCLTGGGFFTGSGFATVVDSVGGDGAAFADGLASNAVLSSVSLCSSFFTGVGSDGGGAFRFP